MIKTYEASGSTVENAIDAALVLADTTLDNVEVEVLELGGKGLFGFGRKDARVRISLEVPDPPAEKSKREKPVEKQHHEKPERRERPQQQRPEREQTAQPKEAPKERPAAADKEGQQSREARAEGDKQRSRSRGGRGRGGRPNGEGAAQEQSQPRSSRPDTDRGYKVSEGTEAEAIAAEAQAFLKPIFAKLQTSPQLEIQVKEGILWLTFSGSGLGSLIGRRGETLNALQYLTNLALNKERKEHLRLVLDVEGYRAGREETLVTLAKKMADKAVRTGRRVELDPMNPHERRIVHIALQNDKRVDTTSHGEEPYRRVVINRRRSNNKPRPQGQGQQNGGQQRQQSAHHEGPKSAEMSLSQQLAQQFDQQMDKRR